MRINKYIALSGVCSRRDADILIQEGRVSVNGSILKTLGAQVLDSDIVELDGKRIRPSSTKVYYLLNKPLGYVTTTDDQFGRPKVTDLVPDLFRVFPVGRLDYNTTGLLILTNDGDFANKISHPSFDLIKTYVAKINGLITSQELSELSQGINLSGRMTSKAKYTLISQDSQNSVVQVQIHEGRNRQIRRSFEAFGYAVLELDRTKIGPLEKGNLSCGQYRTLEAEELELITHALPQS